MKYAKLAGMKVIAMDINDERLQFCAKWVPADTTVNALDDAFETISDWTSGDMPTVVFDATGNQKSMLRCFDFVAFGGQLIYVCLFKRDVTFHDPDFHKKEMTLMGSRNATRADFTKVIDSIINGQIDTGAFITHRAPIDDMIDNFEGWIKPETGVIKAVVEI